MPWGIVIPADESAPLSFQLFHQHADYSEEIGGYFEAVDLESPAASFYVHGEGKIIGLPMNRRASLLIWLHNEAFRGRDVMCGTVVLIGQPDEDGETTDVPPFYIDMLLKHEVFRIEVETLGEPGVWNGNQARYDDWVKAYNAALSLSERWTLVTDIRVTAA